MGYKNKYQKNNYAKKAIHFFILKKNELLPKAR